MTVRTLQSLSTAHHFPPSAVKPPSDGNEHFLSIAVTERVVVVSNQSLYGPPSSGETLAPSLVYVLAARIHLHVYEHIYTDPHM